MKIKVELTKDVKAPTRGTTGSAGWDFYVPNTEKEIILAPGQQALIPSGVRVDLPTNLHLIAHNRSSVAKMGLTVGATVVDSDYTGEIHLHLINVGNQTIYISPGQKICQFVPTWVPATELEFGEIDKVTDRGDGGFGSTGK